MSDTISCPNCNSDLTYPNQKMMVCTQCAHEWEPTAETIEPAGETKVIDANGNELQNGDTVVVIKDLPVKGALRPIKAGTKVKNIRILTDPENDHNIACKIDGFGTMNLKSVLVKKAS